VTETPDKFQPKSGSATALFVDSSSLYAYFYPRDRYHESAREFFEAERTGTLPYRPLFTNDYVLDEVVTRLRRHATHEVAAEALQSIYDGAALDFREVTGNVLQDAVDQFREYDDHGELSFTDHVIAAHAGSLSVDHVLTFDADFETFGLTTIPHYVE
jgi:predicted nucleic acid-binding protein